MDLPVDEPQGDTLGRIIFRFDRFKTFAFQAKGFNKLTFVIE